MVTGRTTTRDLQPEVQLLLCCARTTLSTAHLEQIGPLVRWPLDWSWLAEIAERHGLAPLLHGHLDAASDAVPRQFLEQLRTSVRQTQFQNLHLTGVLFRVFDLLEKEGIPVLTYKGPALAESLYGNLALRTFVDLDFLIRHDDVLRVHEMMTRNGFLADPSLPLADASAGPAAGQFAFQDAEGTALVEFHSEATLRHFPRGLSPAWMFADARTVRVRGREVRTLAPAKLLIALCVHGAKDFWGRLKWVCDIAEFLRVHRELDWPAALEEARRRGCHRMVLLAMALARDLLDADLPPACAQSLAADATASSLGASFRRRLFEERPLSAADRFLFRVKTCESRAEGLRFAFRLATTPAEEDWAAAGRRGGLSKWSPLHSLLRPFRLLRKYGLGPHN